MTSYTFTMTSYTFYWECDDKKSSRLHNFVDSTLYHDLNKYISQLISKNSTKLGEVNALPESVYIQYLLKWLFYL